MSPHCPRTLDATSCTHRRARGFAHTSTKGSHAKFRHPDGRVVIVPLHKSVARGTLSSILRQAGLTTVQLIELLG